MYHHCSLMGAGAGRSDRQIIFQRGGGMPRRIVAQMLLLSGLSAWQGGDCRRPIWSGCEVQDFTKRDARAQLGNLARIAPRGPENRRGGFRAIVAAFQVGEVDHGGSVRRVLLDPNRSEEHTSALLPLMRNSYAVL